jgi:hypothetical protein
MALQLQDVFAGKRMGMGKPQCQAAVDHLPICSIKWQILGMAGVRQLPEDSFGYRGRRRAGNPDNPDTTTPRGRSQCRNGVLRVCVGGAGVVR